MSGPGDRGPRRRENHRSPDSANPRAGARAQTVEGTIREVLPNAMFSVELDNGQKVLTHVSSTMQTRTVRVIPGDRVSIELSPYDPMRGRITRRLR